MKEESGAHITALRVGFILLLALAIGICPVHNFAPTRIITVFAADGPIEVVTNKIQVNDILAEAEIELDPDLERCYPPLDAQLESQQIVIERAAQVKVEADGEELDVVSWNSNVNELLSSNQIDVGEHDLVYPPLDTHVECGQKINIVRVDKEYVRKQQEIPADTVYKDDSNLLRGTTKVERVGQQGVKELTYEVFYHDGQEVSRTLVDEEIVEQAVSDVVLRGTRERTVVSRGSPVGAAQTGIASYYGAGFHGRNTASGVPFDMHAMTAAHRTLPFGTKVQVTFLKTGTSVVVEINDRGPHIAGRIIDLSAGAAKEIGLYAHGLGEVEIQVVE